MKFSHAVLKAHVSRVNYTHTPNTHTHTHTHTHTERANEGDGLVETTPHVAASARRLLLFSGSVPSGPRLVDVCRPDLSLSLSLSLSFWLSAGDDTDKRAAVGCRRYRYHRQKPGSHRNEKAKAKGRRIQEAPSNKKKSKTHTHTHTHTSLRNNHVNAKRIINKKETKKKGFGPAGRPKRRRIIKRHRTISKGKFDGKNQPTLGVRRATGGRRRPSDSAFD